MSLRDYIRETVVCVGVYLVVATFYWEKGFSVFGLFFLFLTVLLSIPIYLLTRSLLEALPDSLWFYTKDNFKYTISLIFSAIFVFFILNFFLLI
jgi:hypothetical protein